MTNTGGTSAWEFLRRNPAYVEAAAKAAAGAAGAAAEPAPITMRVQTGADLEAAAWGLLAWEDPLDGPATGTSVRGTSVSPFWRDAPMLAAAPVRGAPPLAEVLDAPGWRLSGLRLVDGGTVLKVEHGGAAVQLTIADAFDPAGGIELRLPVALDLRTPLLEAAALWPMVAAAPKKAAAASPTASFSRCSTPGSPAIACARSPPPSTARRGSRPSGPPTAPFAPGCAGG